jgi:hypothetical protein
VAAPSQKVVVLSNQARGYFKHTLPEPWGELSLSDGEW